MRWPIAGRTPLVWRAPMLPGGALVEQSYLDGKVIRQMIHDNANGRADHAQALWQLLSVEHWVRAQAAQAA